MNERKEKKERKKERMDGWVGGWADGWMDEWIKLFFLRGRTGTEEAMINQQSKVHLLCNRNLLSRKCHFII